MRKTDDAAGAATNPYADNELRAQPTGDTPRLRQLAPLFKVGERPSDEALELLHESQRPGKGLVFAGWRSNMPVWRLPPGEAVKSQAEASANRQAAQAAGVARYRGQLCRKPEHARWQGERQTSRRHCYGCHLERISKQTKPGGSQHERFRELRRANARHCQQTDGHPAQVAHALRKRAFGALRRLGVVKDRSSETLFGCTFGDMQRFLLLQCEALGFSWEEWGKTWELDHVRPIWLFVGEDEPERAVAWWNSQVLSRDENQTKNGDPNWLPSARQRKAFERAARWMLAQGYAPPPPGSNACWPLPDCGSRTTSTRR